LLGVEDTRGIELVLQTMEVMLLAEVTRESQRRKNDHHSFEFRKTPGLLPQPARRISLATVPTKRMIRGGYNAGGKEEARMLPYHCKLSLRDGLRAHGIKGGVARVSKFSCKLCSAALHARISPASVPKQPQS